MEWVARAIGLFYVFCALVILRQARMNDLMDRALAGITLQPTPWTEKGRSLFGWLIGLACGLSGVALALLSRWSVPLFISGCVIQIGYLAWAMRWLRPDSPEEARGRRQTINAFTAYVAATLYVLWLETRGVLG